MLDHLSEADPELKPKLTGRSADVEESNRHLTYEDLEAYVGGRLAAGQLQHCRNHLDSCEACRAELEDLRSIRSASSGLMPPEPHGRELGRGKRHRGFKLPVAVITGIVFVAAISAVLWWWHARPQVTKPAVAVTPRQSVTPAPGAGIQAPVSRAPDSRLADELAVLPEDMRTAVSEAVQHGKLQLPSDLGLLVQRAPTLPGTLRVNSGFALLAPFGEAISETRPEFRWQPLAGATRYSVTIVDAGLHPVQRSPALRTTGWRPRRPLRRGQTYLWQVTATVHGGSTVVASASTSPVALLRIIPQKLADEIAQFRRRHEAAHLVLGALYGEAGMLTESAEELSKVPPSDASYSIARTLLGSLPSTSPDGAPHQSR